LLFGFGLQYQSSFLHLQQHYDPGSETQVWYAFVCDNHPGSSACSVAAQGSGNSGSPFYVNHSPRINNIYTSSDNKNPGQAVTITASTTDYDHAYKYNIQSLYVCTTSAWTVGGGCTSGPGLCHGSSSLPIIASSSVSCNYTIPIPKNHTSYAYYAFVKDQYQMPAVFNQGGTASYNVNNVPRYFPT